MSSTATPKALASRSKTGSFAAKFLFSMRHSCRSLIPHSPASVFCGSSEVPPVRNSLIRAPFATNLITIPSSFLGDKERTLPFRRLMGAAIIRS